MLSRRRRIAAGSGTDVQDVNRLIKQFREAQKLIQGHEGGVSEGIAWAYSDDTGQAWRAWSSRKSGKIIICGEGWAVRRQTPTWLRAPLDKYSEFSPGRAIARNPGNA